jgi:hypothetical protein
MALGKGKGELRYGTRGKRTVVELTVARGTKMKDILRIQEVISREVLPKIGPVGCAPCLSGIDFLLREELEKVLPVDIKEAKIG